MNTLQPPNSKADTVNPKDLIAAKKLSLTKFPAVAILHANHAMADGAVKYGPYNWRDKPIPASIYVDACKRHLEPWFDGEETADDSGVHHLGHALGCIGIVLDAQESGMLIDDRPCTHMNRGLFARVLARINKKLGGKAPLALDDDF